MAKKKRATKPTPLHPTCDIESCDEEVYKRFHTIAGTWKVCEKHTFWDLCVERGWTQQRAEQMRRGLRRL